MNFGSLCHVGCHEHRSQTPRADFHTTLAVHKAAAKIEPVREVPDVFDFPRDVQPVLNSLCTDCHGYEKAARGGPRAGRLLLTGDRGPIYSHSYYMLTIARLFADGRNQPKSNYDPRALGSSASKLLTMLDCAIRGTHAKEERKFGRLVTEKACRDFTVRLKYKAAKGNGGLNFRIEKKGFIGVAGFQADRSGERAGGLYETNGRSWASQPKPEEDKRRFKVAGW